VRVTLVCTGLENPGVEALSAYLRAHGHDAAVVYEPRPFSTDSGPSSALLARLFEPAPEVTAARVVATRPDLVALSSVTLTHRWSVAVARAVKRERRVPVVCGGPHATGAPAAVLREPAVDAAVVGEGEGALLDLVGCVEGARFGRTDVPNVWFRSDGDVIANRPRPLIRDLDELPFADRAAFYERVPEFERDFMILAQRGCPYRCSYCEHSHFGARYPREPRVRRRSVEHVLAELRAWKARGRMRKVFFWDTIFGLDAAWLRDFAARYACEIALPFECYVHPRTVTRETARLLAAAGCALVRMGVQSVSPTTLVRMDRTGGPAQVRAAAAWLREAGIPVALDHILALPGEGAAEQRDAVRLYAELRPARVVVHWMTFLPGTVAFDEARASGALPPAAAERILAGEAPGFDARHAHELTAAEEDEIARLGVLMDLIPVLPRRLIGWLLEAGAWRGLACAQIVRQLVAVGMAFGRNAALRERMRAFLYLAGREILRGRSQARPDLSVPDRSRPSPPSEAMRSSSTSFQGRLR
jgi:pyruvate-formate lyase-activating enzyme